MKKEKLIIIAGPCVVESKEMLSQVAQELTRLSEKYNFELYFKSSYKKANRTSFDSFTGIGDLKALRFLSEIRDEFQVKVVTDVHSPEEAVIASEYVDVLQIPAFLSRQTDLLISAAGTGKTVNIKKGQFMAPEDIEKAAKKVASTGNENIWLTERGTSFGYHDLVVDFRSMVLMKDYGYPVIFDATHSLQKPSIGTQSGGAPQFIPYLAKAAVAIGVDGLFMEVHPNPAEAKSDAATQLKLSDVENLISQILNIRDAIV